MELSFDKIKEITKGAADIEIIDGMLNFFRFTKAQRELYKTYNEEFYVKCLSASGIKLEFETDSTYLALKAEAMGKFDFAFDLYVDGALMATSHGPKSTTEFVDIELSGSLGNSPCKRVTVYFPYVQIVHLKSVELSDGAFARPYSRQKKMIHFGDSITHGYVSPNPSFTYASRISDALCADSRNKAIGGDFFFPDFANLKDEDFEPDYITVAYGTNDWGKKSREIFDVNCKGFFENISATYPYAKIFAITPIWRGNCHIANENFGEFSYVGDYIKKVTANLPNITVIDGLYLVPHDPLCFIPDVLHPNAEGFRHYANNLYAELKKYI